MTTDHFQIQRILFPTDFSEFSAQALRHALALTLKFKARLKIVHVIPQVMQPGESLYATSPWVLTPGMRQEVEEEMKKFLAPVREARIDHEIEISEGDPWREIVVAAEEMPADLVVMGTHGRSGVERLVLGSVAEKLIRRLPCPVLTVSHEEGRTWESPGLIKKILCATDFSPTSTEALHFALALASRHEAALTLLHVIETVPELGDPAFPPIPALAALRQEHEREALKNVERSLAQAGSGSVKTETRILLGRAYKEILRIAVEDRTDLIVMGAQGHGPIEHLLSGSNAQHVIRRATCPVLTVRAVRHKERSLDGHAGGLALASVGQRRSGKENPS